MQRLPLDESRVRALAEQCRHLNVFPIFIDRYYPKSESHPVSDLLADLVEEALSYLRLLTEADVGSLVSSFPPNIRMFVDYDPNEPLSKSLLERIAIQYLVLLLHEQRISFKEVIANDLNQSIVLQTYPEIRDYLDKDGLVYISDRFTLLEGGIAYKDHILHYHQLLREGYSANPNYDFLRRFSRYYAQTKDTNQFRIAIDHQRLMPKNYYTSFLQKDAWFGPRFDKAKIDDPNAIGLTVQLRVKPSIFDLSSYGLHRTEFYWTHRRGIKSFEIEEISSDDSTFDSYYFDRYIHSERDIERRILRHFDGAVKAYPVDSYRQRLCSKIPREPKCNAKIKLFRIDGNIDLNVWMDLLAHFYKGNEMIIEYFDPKRFEEVFGEKARRYRKIRLEQEGS